MNKLFECKFGSHLYGTATESSDVDIKGLFKASLQEIILGTDSKHIITKTNKDNTVRNSKDDIDVEYKELRTFIKEASQGQTYAIDMLFCPDNMMLSSSEIWREVQNNRLKLISKDCKPIIGYIHQQCAKYAVKGSRLDALQDVINWAKSKPLEARIGEHLDDFPVRNKLVDGEIVEFTKKDHKISTVRKGVAMDELMINVIGMSFQHTNKFKYIVGTLEHRFNQFGQRALMAQRNEGIDWKAVSHAVRLIVQTKELAETGNIIFPLVKKDFVMGVKLGQLDWIYVNDWIARHIDEVFGKVKNSQYLLDKPDNNFINHFLLNTYVYNK